MTTEITDPKATLAELRNRLVEARRFLDLETKEKELDDAPGAGLRLRTSGTTRTRPASVSQRLARYEGLFDMVSGLTAKIDDAEVLLRAGRRGRRRRGTQGGAGRTR